MKRSHVFEANDGKTFATAAECKQHEEDAALSLLIGLDHMQVQDAVDRTNAVLADAFERIGNLIGDKRREDGELRRKKKVVV